MRSCAVRALIIVLAVGLFDVASGDETFLGRSVDQWSTALTSSEGQKRVHAAWAIAQLASKSAGGPNDQLQFAELIKLLSDSDPSVRYWGIQGLGSFAGRLAKRDGGQMAVVNALTPLLDDKSPAPRIAAAQALGELGQSDKALPVVVAAMSDPQDSVRIQAVAALEKLGPASKPAQSTLLAATTDSSEYVKRISQRALASLKAEKK